MHAHLCISLVVFVHDLQSQLHYLSLFLQEACETTYHVEAHADSPTMVLQPMTAAMIDAREAGDGRLFYGIELDQSSPHFDDADPVLADDLRAGVAEEMHTEMIRNMVEGLCIALLEPARVLAHLPGWGLEARRQCEAALPLAHWLQ